MIDENVTMNFVAGMLDVHLLLVGHASVHINMKKGLMVILLLV